MSSEVLAGSCIESRSHAETGSARRVHPGAEIRPQSSGGAGWRWRRRRGAIGPMGSAEDGWSTRNIEPRRIREHLDAKCAGLWIRSLTVPKSCPGRSGRGTGRGSPALGRGPVLGASGGLLGTWILGGGHSRAARPKLPVSRETSLPRSSRADSSYSLDATTVVDRIVRSRWSRQRGPLGRSAPSPRPKLAPFHVKRVRSPGCYSQFTTARPGRRRPPATWCSSGAARPCQTEELLHQHRILGMERVAPQGRQGTKLGLTRSHLLDGELEHSQRLR